MTSAIAPERKNIARLKTLLKGKTNA